jgi:hypothetical protein
VTLTLCASERSAYAEPVTLTPIPELDGLSRLQLLSIVPGDSDALLVTGAQNVTEHVRYWHAIPGQVPVELLQDTVTSDPNGEGALQANGTNHSGSLLVSSLPTNTAQANPLGIYVRDAQGLQQVWKKGQTIPGLNADTAQLTIDSMNLSSGGAVSLVVTYKTRLRSRGVFRNGLVSMLARCSSRAHRPQGRFRRRSSAPGAYIPAMEDAPMLMVEHCGGRFDTCERATACAAATQQEMAATRSWLC